MPVLDAYATAAEYRTRASDKGSGTDATLDAQLLAASRLLERELGVMPGAFNTHTATYRFDTEGGSLLFLRDRAGRGYFLQSVNANGIGVDSDGGGSYDGYTLDFDDAWVRGVPENAALLGEPFTGIELLSHYATASPTSWPGYVGGVRIAGTWGWSAVPGVIKELCVHLTQEIRMGHLGGPMQQVTAFADSMPLSDQTWRTWRLAKQLYSRRMPVVA